MCVLCKLMCTMYMQIPVEPENVGSPGAGESKWGPSARQEVLLRAKSSLTP